MECRMRIGSGRWMSPSLRGSGLKSPMLTACSPVAVSLFTGERIEIGHQTSRKTLSAVSLFTGERIEMGCHGHSSLVQIVSLFTREWIEINMLKSHSAISPVSLFTGEWIEIS